MWPSFKLYSLINQVYNIQLLVSCKHFVTLQLEITYKNKFFPPYKCTNWRNEVPRHSSEHLVLSSFWICELWTMQSEWALIIVVFVVVQRTFDARIRLTRFMISAFSLQNEKPFFHFLWMLWKSQLGVSETLRLSDSCVPFARKSSYPLLPWKKGQDEEEEKSAIKNETRIALVGIFVFRGAKNRPFDTNRSASV